MYINDAVFLRDSAVHSLAKISSPVSLYLHIPFCVRKCRYCDFLSGPVPAALRRRYLAALARELAQTAEVLQDALPEEAGGQIPADSIFVGGGTPSLLAPEEMAALFDVIHRHYRLTPEAEITMECNPGTVDAQKLSAFRRLGINRISIGVQSFRDEELQLLGRIHSAEEARRCVRDAGESGFSNVSLDLMSALPGQRPEEWMQSLREAVLLSPEHISAYSLILEEGTVFWDMARGKAPEAGRLPPFPEDETDRFMYHETKRFLAEHGYHRYEISNYAREGFESRHNNGYWTGHPYLGFGIGAASYLGDLRWTHGRDIASYCRGYEADGEDGPGEKTGACLEEAEQLSRRDRMAECMFLGLRRMEGVSERDFEHRFGVTMESVYADVLRRYEELGLLERTGGRVRLTDAGIDVSNHVMADFL